MDPIHPILPQPPNIPPVTEAPRVGSSTAISVANG